MSDLIQHSQQPKPSIGYTVVAAAVATCIRIHPLTSPASAQTAKAYTSSPRKFLRFVLFCAGRRRICNSDICGSVGLRRASGAPRRRSPGRRCRLIFAPADTPQKWYILLSEMEKNTAAGAQRRRLSIMRRQARRHSARRRQDGPRPISRLSSSWRLYN